MSVVETRPEFIVKEGEQPVLASPSVIGLPVVEPVEQGVSLLTGPVKEAVLAWFVRQGQNKRPDVSVADRLEIARRFWDEERPWGTPVRLTEEYDLSRTSIYNIAHRIAPLFQPRIPGPVAGLKKLISGVETVSFGPSNEQIWSKEEAERLRSRLVLTSLFPGGVTMRPLEDILAEVPGVECSDTTIWRQVKQDGGQAVEILGAVNFAEVSQTGVMPVIDETFFDDRPIFFAVEPGSLAICDFQVPADGQCTAEEWASFLLILKEDRGLNIIGGMGDAAKAYPLAFKTLLEQDDQFREDHFHLLRDLYQLRQKLENKAYRAFEAEYKAASASVKEGTDKAGQKLAQAQAESRRLAEAYDAFAEYASWVYDALQIVDLTSGEIRDRQTNAWLLDEAIAALAQVNQSQVVNMSQRLLKHKPALLAYLDDLAELPNLQTGLAAYLQDPDLAQVVARTVARHWRLQHEVQSNQRTHFRSTMKRAQQEVDLWLAGDPFLEAWAAQLQSLLTAVLRTSSSVENINSIFKPLVKRKKHFANADNAHNFVALFVLWHNLRVFKEGLRQGQSPFEILGLDLGEKDWRTLLGYPPLP
ncbi:MAG: hypothetical protein ACYTEW_24220 [Planctomycetota bacterium]|jgi:hypothetical protein